MKKITQAVNDAVEHLTKLAVIERGEITIFTLSKGRPNRCGCTHPRRTGAGLSNWSCTRPQGHDGFHVALADDELCLIWKNQGGDK